MDSCLLKNRCPAAHRSGSNLGFQVLFRKYISHSYLFRKCIFLNAFRKYILHLGNTDIASVDRGSLDISGQSKMKPSGKGFTPPDTMKNIHDSWEEVEMSTLRVWRKGIQPSWIMEGLRTSTEDVPSDVMQSAGEPESEVEPECGTVLPWSQARARG